MNKTYYISVSSEPIIYISLLDHSVFFIQSLDVRCYILDVAFVYMLIDMSGECELVSFCECELVCFSYISFNMYSYGSGLYLCISSSDFLSLNIYLYICRHICIFLYTHLYIFVYMCIIYSYKCLRLTGARPGSQQLVRLLCHSVGTYERAGWNTCHPIVYVYKYV